MRAVVRQSVVVLLVGLVASPLAADWPTWLEHWLFNSTERTERAVESFEQGDVDAAVEPLETALRLAGDDPRVQYNAGVGRLGSGQGDPQSLLEAVAVAGGELAPLARYNQGNARMAGSDFPGAIEAFQQALRIDPDLEDAKYNLELAQRRLETQEEASQEEQEQEQEQDGSGSGQGEQDQEQQDQQGQKPPPEQERDEDREQEQEQEQQPQQSPLPQFRDLPDMTAQEAAAILEAIENMEREDRRREAIEAAAQYRSGKKDW